MQFQTINIEIRLSREGMNDIPFKFLIVLYNITINSTNKYVRTDREYRPISKIHRYRLPKRQRNLMYREHHHIACLQPSINQPSCDRSYFCLTWDGTDAHKSIKPVIVKLSVAHCTPIPFTVRISFRSELKTTKSGHKLNKSTKKMNRTVKFVCVCERINKAITNIHCNSVVANVFGSIEIVKVTAISITNLYKKKIIKKQIRKIEKSSIKP